MNNNSLRQSYLLGISIGISVSIFIFITLVLFDKVSLYADKNSIIKENANLKNQLEISMQEIEKLKLEKTSNLTEKKPQEQQTEKVVLDIKSDMTNQQIAELLVKNGIYKHTNDILLIMEILNFNRYEYSKILEEKGHITSAYDLNKSLKEIEDNQYQVSDALYLKKIVKDKNSFMKLLYLLDIKNEIKYGKKEFKKDSSLREICDVLMK